jgi:hypothetical protein
MCPACIATVTWIVAGATSSGGLTALAVKKRWSKNRRKQTSTQPNKRTHPLDLDSLLAEGKSLDKSSRHR